MKRTLMLSILITSGLVLGIAFWQWGIISFFSAKLPSLVFSKAVQSVASDEKAGQKIGSSFVFEKQGIQACVSNGTASMRGFAQGRLYEEKIKQQQAVVDALTIQLSGGRIRSQLVQKHFFISNKYYNNHLSDSVKAELFGLTVALENSSFNMRKQYNNCLNQQLVYDRLHHLKDQTLLQGLAFGITEQWTKDDAILLARSFDFKYSKELEANKVVRLVTPQNGYRYIAVGWPGFIGVVTGMNEHGLGLALLAAPSKRVKKRGQPVALLARQVLEQAKTLAEAEAIIATAAIGVSESFFIGSGEENKFVVIEKSPNRLEKRKMKYGIALATNRFQSKAFEAELAGQVSGISKARQQRLNELIYINKGKINVERAVKILRDRRGLYGTTMSMGHPHAINALNTCHGVVMDLKKKVLWVGASPYQLGAFVPFSFDHFSDLNKKESIPADRLVTFGFYKNYVVYQLGKREAEGLLKQGRYQEALAWIQEMSPLNPKDYQAYILCGRALQALGRKDEAIYNYQQASRLKPAYPEEQQFIKEAILQLKQGK